MVAEGGEWMRVLLAVCVIFMVLAMWRWSNCECGDAMAGEFLVVIMATTEV